MNHRRMTQAEVGGILAGVAAAVVLLAVLSILLLQPEGTSVKVLVAVWLWSLPVLGIGALLGWLLAHFIHGVER